MNNLEIAKLADKIARDIFADGDELSSPCNRIQFKGGTWPDNERNQGGFNEGALATCIRNSISNYFATNKVVRQLSDIHP